jgi:hypothetical protein
MHGDRFLEGDDLAHAIVLDAIKRFGGNGSGTVRTGGFQQAVGPHKAADMLGAKGGIQSVTLTSRGGTERCSAVA